MPSLGQDGQPAMNGHANGHANGQTNGHSNDTSETQYDFGDASEPIAIIGLATRFPHEATTTNNLWDFLLKGRSAWSEFPADRIDSRGHYHPDPEHGGTFAVKGGHFFAEDPAYFDAPFYSTTRSEVLSMDPQQRLVLENVYQALENAGISIPQISTSNTSVFVSGFNHDHLANLNTDAELNMKYKPTGASNSLLSNRVSWFFNLVGPSLTLDTACSSSMVAMHLACQSLLCGESNMGIVNGVTIISNPIDQVGMSHHGFLGKDGRCYSFDHRAEGYARGEGVGTVIVKRLRDALRDGDTIRAVVRGTASNQDGRTAGIALPSSQAQEALMRTVYGRAGLDFAETRMVESHGTGTAAGDPLEASAIARVFSSSRSPEEPIYVGAIKSVIGHMEGAAGVAGIIKGVLVLESGVIPPNNNFEKVNPKIPMKKWNIAFPLETMPWPSKGLRRISINSFGVGGTNAHLIMDDAHNYFAARSIRAFHNTVAGTPTVDEVREMVKKLETIEAASQQPPSTEEDVVKENGTNGTNGTNGISGNGINGNGITNGGGHADDNDVDTPRIFSLSSFDESGVQRAAQALAAHLKRVIAKSASPMSRQQTSEYLDDLAYTLSNKRNVFPWQSYAIGSSLDDLVTTLESEHSLPKPVRVRNQAKIGFVFTGQGSQWYAMGRELMVYSLFRESLQQATEYYRTLGADWSLLEELSRDKAASKVNEPWLSHPACVSLQIALIELLRSWGIVPARVVGHSSGEIAAAYAASRLSREAAWKTAYFRGVVSARQLGVKGSMMAVGLPADILQGHIDQINQKMAGELVISCFNSPANQTVSGDVTKIDALKALLDEAGDIFARKLNVVNAYHSAHMREVADEYLTSLSDLNFGDVPATKIELFSSVTGKRVTEAHLDASYWVDNMVSPVRFHEAVTAMCFSKIQGGQASLKMNTNAENIFSDTLIEIGPHGAMRSAVKETLTGKISASLFNYMSVLSRTAPGLTSILETVGFVNSHGTRVNLQSVNKRRNHEPRMLVELPPYSFNHTDKNLYESRLLKNYRLRKHPRHDLFGAPVPDWNAEFPRWRNVLRVSEQPWIKDHVVTNILVYPGVGYVIAVLEACRQMADPEQTLLGFRLRDVSLKRALTVPESKEGIEVVLSMTRMDEASLQGSAIWKRFLISSYDALDESWVEHCTGYVATDYEVADGPIDNGFEAKAEAETSARDLATARERCTVPVDQNKTYDELSTAGITFGPLFRNLSNVFGTPELSGEAFGTITVPDVAEVMPKKFMHSHYIHPATMDSFMHLFLASIIDGTGRKTIDRAMIPTFLKEVWVSADVHKKPGETYVGHSKSTLLAYDKFESNVTVWDGSSDKELVSIKGIRGAPLDSAETAAKGERKLCHNIINTPDPDLLTKQALEVQGLETPEQAAEHKERLFKGQVATALRITDALEELEASGFDPSILEGHFVKYHSWMKKVKELVENGGMRGASFEKWKELNADPTAKAELFEEFRKQGSQGELAMRMGEAISKVLRKEVDPLHLMFGMDDLLDRVYSDLVALGDLPTYNRAFLDAVRRSSNNLHILEVGAGVGSSTVPVLEALAPLMPDEEAMDIVELRIAKYTFTDISSRFFEKAQEKFKAHESIMEYKAFNAEIDGDKQGIQLKSYDYIFAGNVVHATGDLRKTLGALRKLLKPGGKLVLQEGTRQDDLAWNVSFGQLPGWWMAVEPDRQWSPWIPIPQWDAVLKDAGYTGIDLELADRTDEELHSQSIIVATAQHEEDKGATQIWEKTFIVTSSSAEGGSELAAALKERLLGELKVPECSILHYTDITKTDVSQSVCVSVLELEKEILPNPTEDEFNNVRQLLATCGALLWITGDTTVHPTLNMITGLARTVRWERDVDGTNIAILSVQEPAPQGDLLLSSITKLFTQQFIHHLPTEKSNSEFTLCSDGSFLSARLVDSNPANDYLTSRLANPLPTEQRLGDAGRPVKLATASPGQLDMLQWVTDDLYNKPLGETELEIDIKAVGLNFRDLIVAMGEHMALSLGYEASGLITRIGSGVTKFQPGERVSFMCGLAEAGCFQTFGRSEEAVTVKLPSAVSFESGAGLPCVYSTVIYGLDNAARLQKGESILIHAAAGGVGQAAIQFCQYIGAEIFATVSTPEKRDLLMKEYGIPSDHIFSSRDSTFVKGIMRATNNRGVDCVLNSLAGELLRRSWDLLAPFGRFVEIGKKDAQLNGKVDLHPFLRNVTMTSVELPTMMRHKPQLIHDLMTKTFELYVQGHIGDARPTKVMSFAQIPEGFRILQSGKGTGKMVFVPSPDDIVSVVPIQQPSYKLEANATYVLAGGLGGIGRSLARWLATKGARHLVFLSRSGKLAGDAVDMVSELKQKGCESHVFACDVADAERMKEVLEECQRTLPPIKGCIQGSMVLQDGMFENMTAESWMKAVRPKVQGSWNLHNFLPRDMEFFVQLSSAAGVIGNRSQANYSAGNTFQDALARHRLANGLPCSAIDLGTVLSVGYVAERQALSMMRNVHGAVHEVLKEEEIQLLVEYLMDPRSALDQTTSQLVSGMTTAAKFRQAGMPIPTYLGSPLCTHLRAERSTGAAGSRSSASDAIFKVQAQLAAATTVEEAAAVALEGVRTKLSSLLATPVDNINPAKSVSSNGIDSLIAMEFRAFLVKDLGADIPLLDITGTSSVAALSVKIASASKLTQLVVQDAKAV